MNSSIPSVSYVLTSYNFSETIVQSLDCIFKDAGKNCELIYRDDCSSDATYERVLAYLTKQKKSKFLKISINRNERNVGAAENISQATSLAEGEFIRIVAGDDFIRPGSTGELIEFCKRLNKRACIGRARFIAEGQIVTSKPIEFLSPNSVFRAILPSILADDIFFRTLFFWDLRGSVLLIEKNFLRYLGGIRGSEALEDWNLLIRVSFEQQLGSYPGEVATVTKKSREIELANGAKRIEWTFETLRRHKDKIEKKFGILIWILYLKYGAYNFVLFIYRFLGRF